MKKALAVVCAVVGMTVFVGCAASQHTTAPTLRTLRPVSATLTPAGNKLAAVRDARRLLGLVRLPDGAQRLAHDGGALGDVTIPVTPELIERSRYWSVPGSFADVWAYMEAHPPSGSHYAGSASSSSPTGSSEAASFTFPPKPGQISSRQVNVTVAVLPDGSTGVGAHAQDIWIVPRSAHDAVPHSVTSLDISSRYMDTARVTGWKLHRIVRWFNALPIAQPETHGCFAEGAATAPLNIVFRGANRRPLARARFTTYYSPDPSFGSPSLYSSWCAPIFFSIRDRHQSLVGGDFFERVQHLIGRAVWVSHALLTVGATRSAFASAGIPLVGVNDVAGATWSLEGTLATMATEPDAVPPVAVRVAVFHTVSDAGRIRFALAQATGRSLSTTTIDNVLIEWHGKQDHRLTNAIRLLRSTG